MNLATQQVIDRVVSHYLRNVELQSPGLPVLAKLIANNRTHFAGEVAGRVFWTVVERECLRIIATAIRTNPHLADKLAAIRSGRTGCAA